LHGKICGDTALDANMLDAAYGLDPLESPSMIVMITHMEWESLLTQMFMWCFEFAMIGVCYESQHYAVDDHSANLAEAGGWDLGAVG
jgi:hypothetical protein